MFEQSIMGYQFEIWRKRSGSNAKPIKPKLTNEDLEYEEWLNLYGVDDPGCSCHISPPCGRCVAFREEPDGYQKRADVLADWEESVKVCLSFK